jgi:ketosteroid isomerase-like protein
MGKTFHLMLVASVIITACQFKTKTVSDDINAIRNIQDLSVAVVRAKDINKIINMYSSDAIEMPPDEPIAIGIESIKKGWELWFSDTTYLHDRFTETIDNIEVSASGDFGYVRTTSHIIIKTTNRTIGQEQKNIYIYEKKKGEWKCILAIWNNNKPMEGQ